MPYAHMAISMLLFLFLFLAYCWRPAAPSSQILNAGEGIIMTALKTGLYRDNFLILTFFNNYFYK
jgi:hypothetical protein